MPDRAYSGQVHPFPADQSQKIPKAEVETRLRNDLDAIQELKGIAKWVLYRVVYHPSGKTKKPPLTPRGWKANHSDPKTWSTHEDCRAAWRERPFNFHGYGFVLQAKEDGIIAIDLDDCRNHVTGEIRPWAMELVFELASYTEVSPSGTGLKIFVRADPVPAFSRFKLTIVETEGPGHNEQIEVMTHGYSTVTGDHLDSTVDEITDATEALERLAHRLASEGEETASTPSPGSAPPGNPSPSPADSEAFDYLTSIGVDIDRSDELSDATMKQINKGSNLRDLWADGAPPKTLRDTSASSLDMSLASRLHKYSVPPQQIVSALWQFQHGQAVKMDADEFRRQIARILYKILKSADDQERRQEALSSRFAGEIEVTPGEFDHQVEKTADYLGDAEAVCKRGSILVVPTRIADAISESRNECSRSAGSLIMTPVTAASMYYLMAKHVRYYTESETEDGETKRHYANPPEQIGPAILSTPQVWGKIKRITAVSEVPLLTLDGRVILKPGLDPSGVLFDPGSTVFFPGGAKPAFENPGQALNFLMSIIQGFPYVDEAARSTMLAAMLTVYCRPFLRSAPMFVFTAPKMGSGKSLQATILSYIATGKAPAMMSQAEDAESERKRVLSILLGGSAVSVIDNIERPLSSDTLCSVLTEPIFGDRLLVARDKEGGTVASIRMGQALTLAS